MKAFWLGIVSSVIIIGSLLFMGSAEPEETAQEGFVQEVQYIEFEATEINVPVRVYDFSNEEPMLITPDMEE